MMDNISIPVTQSMIDDMAGFSESLNRRFADLAAMMRGEPLPPRPWPVLQRQALTEFTASAKLHNPTSSVRHRIKSARMSIANRIWPSDEPWCDHDEWDD